MGHVDHLSTVSFRTRQWILRRFLEKDRAFIVTIHCRHWFLCLGYIGAAVHRRRLVFICAIVNTFFVVVKCALYLAFFLSLHSLAAWFHRFFHTGLQVACSERDEPSELLPVKRCRSPELRVVHFRDVELMTKIIR